MSNENKSVNQEKIPRWVNYAKRPSEDWTKAIIRHIGSHEILTEDKIAMAGDECFIMSDQNRDPVGYENCEWLEEIAAPSLPGIRTIILSAFNWAVEIELQKLGPYWGKDYSIIAYSDEGIVEEFFKTFPISERADKQKGEMSEEFKNIKPWPLMAHAPGNYSCICCHCKNEFRGDKRAVECLECAVKITHQHIHSLQSFLSSITKERNTAIAEIESWKKENFDNVAEADITIKALISERDALREGSQQWRDEYNIAREQRDALYKAAAERIAYLIKTEKEAIDELDSKSVGSPERYSSWALIKELSSRRQELQQMFPKPLINNTPNTNG